MPHSTSSPSSESCTLEPIAICGMSCRLPGAVDSASSLWDMLVEKRSGQMDEVPKSRFNIAAHYHENLNRPGSFNVRGGYFLDGQLENFDPTAFNITPVEAQWLDPQQRKMLEVSYECMESAGLTLEAVAGSNTAVFVGSFTSDYQQMSIKEPDFRHNYAATGVDPGIISNRIGNTFNLNGPSFTINTACSSSVYAIHYACHSLRARDCDAAIAGGVNLILTVDQHMNTAKLGILSPTSTCHTFDAAADGYGRAEGAGALYLKRLSDAIRSGDPVRGVIRGTAVNTNGKVLGMGITHPSVQGQERVVRKAYEAAGLDAKNTGYVELHGTGTPVGDPIEVRAIANAMNDDRSKNEPLLLGAIKPNIGHSEAASGIFAVMKAALMTEASVIPGIAHFNTLNPAIDERGSNVKVNIDTKLWPPGLPVKRASVSSFGYGGTNGHVIVESAKTLHPWYHHGTTKHEADYDHSAARPLLLCFSAHDKATLGRNVAAIGEVAHKYYPADLAFTFNTRRTRFPERCFTIIRQEQESEAFLEQALRHGTADRKPPRIGYLFTGQGAQWTGMGASAMLAFPSFHETIRNLDEVLSRLETKPSFSLEQVLLGKSHADQINNAELAQPLCTAIQIAIVDLFQKWEIEPDIAIGHSSGEIGAAYATGLISAPEAILAAFYRGYAVKHHSSSGTMLAVGIGAEEVSQYLLQSAGDVVIACENSPNSVTLSGQVEAIHNIKRLLDTQRIFARELKTGKAYHSPSMGSVSIVYNELLSNATRRLDSHDLDWRRASTSMISSVTGKEIITTHLDASYWSDNLRCRVRFDAAIDAVGTDSISDTNICFIEIGPHSALSGPFKQICTAKNYDRLDYVPSLIRDRDDTVQLLSVAGLLFLKDYPLSFEAVNDLCDRTTLSAKHNSPSLLVDLPPYQWNYEKVYWTEPRSSLEQRHLKHARHDLLGSKVSGLSDRSGVWRNVLRHQDIPWLKDHTLGNVAVFPAAGYMAMAIEALRQVHETFGLPFVGTSLRDVDIKTALMIPEDDDGVEIQLQLRNVEGATDSAGWQIFAIESLTDGHWINHCDGIIGANINVTKSPQDCESPVQVSKLAQRVPGKRWYNAFSRIGFDYKGSFQQLHNIKSDRKRHEAAAAVLIRDSSGTMEGESRYIIHPATVDACLQLIIISIHAGMHKEMPWGVVPIKINQVDFRFPQHDLGSLGNAVAWTDTLEARHFNTYTKLMGTSGDLIMDVKGLRCVAYEAAIPPASSHLVSRQPYMRTSWQPDISTLNNDQIVQHCESPVLTESICKLLRLLDHKHGLMNVILLGRPNDSGLTALLQGLSSNMSVTIAYTRVENMEFHQHSDEADPRIMTSLISKDITSWATLSASAPDLIIIWEDMLQFGSQSEVLRTLKDILGERGWMIICSTDSPLETMSADFSSCGWSVSPLHLGSGKDILLCDANSGTASAFDDFQSITVLCTDADKDAGPCDALFEALRALRVDVHVKMIQDFNASTDQSIVLLDKAYDVLVNTSESSFKLLQAVLCAPVSILWLMKGVKDGSSAIGGVVEGFVRVIRSEQAAARIALIDYDSDERVENISQAILTGLHRSAPNGSGGDLEFWLHHGILHVARIESDTSLNMQFSGPASTPEPRPLAADVPLVGSIKDGQIIFRQDIPCDTSDLDEDQVEIQVKFSQPSSSAGANVFVTGTTLRTGTKVGSYFMGKDVVAYTTSSFSTIIRTSVWAPAPPELDVGNLLSGVIPVCPAVNASILTARAQSQDWLLLLPAPLNLTSVYILLSQIMGWKLTVVANNDQEKETYITEFGLYSEDIIDATQTKIVVDLVQNCPTTSNFIVVAHTFSLLSKEVWRSMKPLGRFILNETSIEEPLDVSPFRRGASFHTARVSDLVCRDAKAAQKLLKFVISLLTEHEQRLLGVSTSHDIGTVQFTDTDHAEGAIIAYDYQKSLVHFNRRDGVHRFSANATYLLVGCLGGLGRSLTTWMIDRGAKHFAFISRSGADKSEAAEVVRAIEQIGASAEVFRGDASDGSKVRDIVNSLMAKRPIRGVVHAAMVLRDGMYESMSAPDFQAVITPKLKGAQVLDEVFEGIDLDFFVMTSSISAILGNPGQCNYSAANSFLDSLAWRRNLQSQAGTSLVLPMILDVGVVSENEDIEVSLSRKGLYGIDEQEMLRGFEIAMSRPVPRLDRPAPEMGDSQIILGLEPSELAKTIANGDTVDTYWYNDARLHRIRTELERAAQTIGSADKGGDFKKTLKAAFAESFEASIDTIAQHVMQRASSILKVPVEDFKAENVSIADYGLDSMIGAELRTWLFKEFGLDMPFQQLLSPSSTFKRLALIIAEDMGLLAS